MNIYKRYEALSPIYSGSLTNHLPMVLTACKKLGLSDEEIINKLDQYRDTRAIYDLTDSNSPIDDFNQEYINRTSFYLGEFNRKSEDIVIGEFVNKNKYNIASALFHGLIRLAYAKQEKNTLMIAQALAYFEVSLDEIEIIAPYSSEEDFNTNYATLQKNFNKLNLKFESKRTMEKFNELLSLKLVSDNIVNLRNPNREFILNFILTNYLKTEDFFILHLITGFEALLVLEEYLFDFDDVLNHFLLLAQIFILFNSNQLVDEVCGTKDLYELTNEVSSLEDFHDIKLFYSLVKLDKLFDNKQITLIANRIFKL